MSRPIALDLFCGGGGASMGYHRAGFDVVGVDINDQPDYPFPFVKADALNPPMDLSRFDLIHASPPCQAYSTASHYDHPDLVGPVRDLLLGSGRRWVMENVPQAPMQKEPSLFGTHGVVLCGSMFGLRNGRGYLRRHRVFESSVLLPQLDCHHSARAIGVHGHQGLGEWEHHMGTNLKEGGELMGVTWMRWTALVEAIPPAYTEWIGRQILEAGAGSGQDDKAPLEPLQARRERSLRGGRARAYVPRRRGQAKQGPLRVD